MNLYFIKRIYQRTFPCLIVTNLEHNNHIALAFGAGATSSLSLIKVSYLFLLSCPNSSHHPPLSMHHLCQVPCLIVTNLEHNNHIALAFGAGATSSLSLIKVSYLFLLSCPNSSHHPPLSMHHLCQFVFPSLSTMPIWCWRLKIP